MIGSDGEASQSFLRTARLIWRSARLRDCLPTRPWTGPLSAQRRGTLPLVQAALASQRNGMLSTHIRCRMTARRRATATVAFPMPRRRAMASPHVFSGELFVETAIGPLQPLPKSSECRHRHTSRCPDLYRSPPIGSAKGSIRSGQRPIVIDRTGPVDRRQP